MKTKPSFLYLVSFVFCLSLCPSPCALSQIPQGFNYQAIARDGSGAILQNTPLQAMMYVQSLSTGGTLYWKELHSSITTNSFGLFTLVVGTGTRQTESTVATFDLVDWSVSPKYLKTEIYYSGSWKDMGTSQLYSVPYALRAKDSDQWLTSGSNIYRPSGSVGIGTPTPQFIFETVGFGALIRNPDPTTYSTLRLYNDKNSSVRSLEIDYMGSTSIWGEQGNIVTTGAFPLNLGTSNSTRLTISSAGNVGIGTTTPISRLTVNGSTSGVTTTGTAAHSGQFQARAGSTAQGQRAVYSFYPTFEATPADNVVRRAADIVGGYNGGAWGSEYLSFNVGNNNLANDAGNITSEKMRITSNGLIGIGTSNPTSKFVIQPPADWGDNTALFEVRNKTGVPIFAVYNNGVRILIDHSESKGIKSGFAVGGYDMTKAGKTVDFMNISPDSIRFNINNDNVKGKKGGFAVGGYDLTKGPINQDFMYITPQTSDNGQYNTFLGYKAGTSNTFGTYNTIFGYEAGKVNSNGWANVFIGHQAGTNNIGSENPVTMPFNGNFNIFIGRSSGFNNTRGGGNVYIGENSGSQNTTGDFNTCVGGRSGALNQLGNNNAIFGMDAGYKNTVSNNTMIGYKSGYNNTTGSSNVFMGYAAGYYETGSNKLFIDNQSRSSEADGRTKALIYGVFDASASNQLVVINGRLDVPNLIRATGVAVPSSGAGLELSYSGGVSYVESYDRSGSASLPLCLAGSVVYPFTQMNLGSSANRWNTIYCVNAVNVSDSRLKRNIRDLEYGLASIMQLEPVTFIWNDQSNEDKHIGLIAQDVAEVIKEVVDVGDDSNKTLGINYSQLVPVLIKGMQEQQQQIDSTKQENQQLKSELQSLKDKMDRIETMLAKGD